jgi:hypothetical protein
MPKSDIPMGSEFGPNQIELVEVLELALEHTGDKQEFIAAIGRKYDWPLATAKNTLLSMKKYLLLDEDDQLTEEGKTQREVEAHAATEPRCRHCQRTF